MVWTHGYLMVNWTPANRIKYYLHVCYLNENRCVTTQDRLAGANNWSGLNHPSPFTPSYFHFVWMFIFWKCLLPHLTPANEGIRVIFRYFIDWVWIKIPNHCNLIWFIMFLRKKRVLLKTGIGPSLLIICRPRPIIHVW